MKKLSVFLFIAAVLVTVSCGNNNQKGAVDGKSGNISSAGGSTSSFANLSVTLPKDWQSESGETRFRAASPDEIAILLIDDYTDKSFADVAKNPKKFLSDFLDDDLGESEYKILKDGEEDINGLKSFFVYYSYDAGDVGNAVCYTYAIDTGKGVALLTFDVLESDLEKMKDTLGQIKKSIAAK